MSKSVSQHITSCTVSWENHDDILSAVTRVLPKEIQVRFYSGCDLLYGKIPPEKHKKKPRFPAAFFIFGGATQI